MADVDSTEPSLSPSLGPHNPSVLTLSYGGTKGIGHIGALKAFEDYVPEYLKNLDIYVGCSAGTANCLMLYLGFSLREIYQESMTFSLVSGMDEIHLGKVFDTSTLGFVDRDRIKARLESFILKKYDRVPTLFEAFQLTGKRFVATAVNHTKSQKLYFDYENSPNLSVIDATLMSMNVPVLMYTFPYQGDVVVDGALKDPYPILLYDDGTRDIMGISIITEHSVAPDESIIAYYNKNIGHALEELRSISVQRMSSRCRSLDLRLTDVSILDTGADPNARFRCYVEGYRQAEAFIAQMRGQTLAAFYGPFIPPSSSAFTPVPFRIKKKQKRLEVAQIGTSVGGALFHASKSFAKSNGSK